MDRQVRYHSLFSEDVIEAAEWYDERSLGLGSAFVQNVRIAVEKILSMPDKHPKMSGDLRYRSVERFPYVILFDVTEKEILLLGVLHTARSITK